MGSVATADEDQLLALGQAGQGLVAQAQLVEGRGGRTELALAAVDQHEVGQVLALLEQALVAPAHHLAHGGEVVGRARPRVFTLNLR